MGLYDNSDKGLTDEKILTDLQHEIAMYPKESKILFVLVQSLSERRFNLAMETEKYLQVFGNSFLKSALIIGSCYDLVVPKKRDEAQEKLT